MALTQSYFEDAFADQGGVVGQMRAPGEPGEGGGPRSCQGDERWDPIARACVPGTGTQCPDGWKWSAADGGCVEDTESGLPCPTGQMRDKDGYCVVDPAQSGCPPGEAILYPGGPCVGGTSAPATNPYGEPSGGGGGGGGGGVRSSALPALPKGPQWDLDKDPVWLQLQDAISKALAGGTTFDKDTIERMKGAARIRSENMRDTAVSKTRSNLIARGIGSSPIGAALEAEASRAADQDYAATASQIEVQAAVQNYQDRVGALDRAERLLNSKMGYVLGLANNEVQRAEIALGYRRLDAARENLELELANKLQMMHAGFNFEKEMFDLRLPLLIAQMMDN